MFGGPGDEDEVLGSLGIDRLRGGRGNRDLVQGGYGYDRMDGGPGAGDIASFATAVSGQQGPGQGLRPPGVRASLRRGLAIGDGRDLLRRLESIEGSAFADVLAGDGRANLIDGGPGDDRLMGRGGRDLAQGDTGSDRCRGFSKRRSCGNGRRTGAFAQIDLSPLGSRGLVVLGGRRRDVFRISTDPATGIHTVRSARRIAIGPGCSHPDSQPRVVVCGGEGAALPRTIDLGGGDDRLEIGDSVENADTRIGLGPGDDEVRGGIGGELIEAGTGADRLFGGAGSDGLVGGVPGRDLLVGGGAGDLLAAGSACIGGKLIGGPGRDNASFAEAPGHPGVMHASLAAGRALIRALPRCRPVRLHRSNEDLEGTFDWDILIGDGRPNSLLGQPGRDRFYGLGGRDVINAYDRERDFSIDCGRDGGVVLDDRRDPRALRCTQGTITGPAAELPRHRRGR